MRRYTRRELKAALPKKGKVGIFRITDKQFGMMEIFEGKEQQDVKPPPQQLEIFNKYLTLEAFSEIKDKSSLLQ